MNNLGLVIVLLAQILVLQLQAMAHEFDSQAPLPGLNSFQQKTETGVELNDQKTNKVEDHHPISGATESSSSSSEGESTEAEAPQIRRLGKHHSSEKSVAGGGVIIGGLVTAIFAAVFCYIRVTRKRDTRYLSN